MPTNPAELIELLKFQVAEIMSSPIPFIAALILMWILMEWRFSAKYKHQLENKDGEIKLQDRQLADYKEKLNGATPDEAKSKIEVLEARLARLEPRRITENQRLAIIDSLRGSHASAGVVAVTHDGTCADCNIFAVDLLNTISTVTGWQTRGGAFIGHNIQSRSGLSIAVQHLDMPSPQASAIMKALQAAKIDFDTIVQPPSSYGAMAQIMVTARLA